MINVRHYLLNSNLDIGTYALTTYNGKTEATWFTRYNFGDGDWFLESPCELYRITEVDCPIDEFAKEYVSGLLEDGEDEDSYIENYIKPMIVDGVLYEIENFQCSPYLPEFVDDIKIINSRECLEYLLQTRAESPLL